MYEVVLLNVLLKVLSISNSNARVGWRSVSGMVVLLVGKVTTRARDRSLRGWCMLWWNLSKSSSKKGKVMKECGDGKQEKKDKEAGAWCRSSPHFLVVWLLWV